MVPKKYEHRNNLSRIHGFLTHIPDESGLFSVAVLLPGWGFAMHLRDGIYRQVNR
jgi:hypothetical protein